MLIEHEKGIFYINHFSALLSFRFFATSNNSMMSLHKQQIMYIECNAWKQLFADKFSHAFIENRSIALLFRNSLWIKNNSTLLNILIAIRPVCMKSNFIWLLKSYDTNYYVYYYFSTNLHFYTANYIIEKILYVSSTYTGSNTLNTFVNICTIQMHDVRE